LICKPRGRRRRYFYLAIKEEFEDRFLGTQYAVRVTVHSPG
jgi:hypothetical protein